MAEPDPAEDPETVLARHATALADAVEEALPAWVERSVRRRLATPGGDVLAAAAEAGARARDEVGGEVRALLAADVDAQWTGPLALLRRAARYPTEVLRGAGAPSVPRDEFAERAFPDDVYDLAPATWADLDPGLHDLGVTWGAAKAWVVLARRRAEGRR